MHKLNEYARPIRLLIVEDHPLIRMGLRMLLECDGLLIREASSGPESIIADAEFAPDVILMDLSLPGMSGIQAVQIIRNKNLVVKIIAFTSHDTTEHRESASGAGVNSYLLKETSPEVLVATINALLDSELSSCPSDQTELSYA